MFKNRKKEMKILEDLHKSRKPKLVILYGRRRVGKTELLNEFGRKHKSLYLLARQESVKDQLKKMSDEIATFFDDKVLQLNPFQNYDALFAYLIKKDIPILFDEFPFLVESYKPLPSILQEYWDKYFSKKPSFIVLCGSSIQMMETLLGYKSPLYGRRTEQFLLEPLTFNDACEFFPGLSKDQKIIHYAVLGGTPAYLLEFNYARPLRENIRENILMKNKFLYQDTLFVMQQELKEPAIYYSIIKSIAKGNTKLGHIINDTGLEKGKVIKYLSVLQNLHLIERRTPVTEKNKEKSRRGIYLLKDNYFKFWFRFIFGNEDYIEQNLQDKLLDEKVMPELPSYIGKIYEEIALEWVKKQKRFKNFLFGRWWERENEIDIIGIDNKEKRIAIGEVKWKKISKKDIQNIFDSMKKKSKLIEFRAKKEDYFLIGREIKNKPELRKLGYKIFDIDDIVN